MIIWSPLVIGIVPLCIMVWKRNKLEGVFGRFIVKLYRLFTVSLSGIFPGKVF
jgi:hypothetical protein